MARVTQQHVDARRESILDAAARLFARKGVNSATMSDIAAEAGLSAGAIYRYFGSKDDLLRAVFDEAVERNERLFREESESAPSPLTALQNIGRRIWVEHDDRDSLICEVQMALSAARDPDDFGLDLSRNRQVIRELLKSMIEAAQASGEIDPYIDATALALILQAASGGIQTLKLEDGDSIDIQSAFDLMVQMVSGLRASSSAAHER